MVIFHEDAGKAALDPVREVLHECFRAAWRTWKETIEPTLPFCTPRTRACMLHDLIVGEIERRLGSSPLVQIKHVGQRVLLWLAESSVVVRVKKLDREFRTSNFPTRTSKAFDAQLPLPGIPEGVRLTVGYRLNSIATELLGIWVVLPVGKRIEWRYELTGAEVDLPIQLPLASTAKPAAAAPKPPRIRRKASDKAVLDGQVGSGEE